MITTNDWTFLGQRGTVTARTWRGDRAPNFTAILVHGYGEHIGRYQHVAEALVGQGAVVYGLDHLGHGHSEGERALIDDFTPLVADVDTVVDTAVEEYPDLPVVMIGHSMGGMIGARYGQLHADRLAALVLSGPAIGDFVLIEQLAAADEVPDIPIDPSVLSRDEAVGKAYMDDELVWHGGFKKPTVDAFAAMISTINQGGSIGDLPLLWIHGEDDQLVPIDGTRAGIERISGSNTTAKIYPGARHEVFNETNKGEVLGDVGEFIATTIG